MYKSILGKTYLVSGYDSLLDVSGGYCATAKAGRARSARTFMNTIAVKKSGWRNWKAELIYILGGSAAQGACHAADSDLWTSVSRHGNERYKKGGERLFSATNLLMTMLNSI